MSPVPGQDSNVGGISGEIEALSSGEAEETDIPRVAFYNTNNQTVSLTLNDTPGALGVPLSFMGGDLQQVKRNNEFVSYLFAQNRTTGARIYLKWIRWRAKFRLDVNVHFASPYSKSIWKFEIISQGDGVGPYKPIDTIFESSETIK